MATDIGPKIGLEGEREFKNAIRDINTSLKTLDSEMKVVTSEFIGNEKSMESLTKQNEVYERQVLTLNDKLKLQGDRLKEAADAYGEADTRTQKLQQEYNKTQAQINTYNSKIAENNKVMEENGKVATETAGNVKKGAEESAAAHDKHVKALKNVGLAFVGMASAAAAAVGAAVAAVAKLGKSLGNMALSAANAADEIATLSVQTGLSAEELQKYRYASDLIDVSVETITGSMSKLTKNMSSAAKGSKSTTAAFEKLGVSVTDSNGGLRDRNEVFNETIKALGQIENETERDAAAMDIFGNSARDLKPLIMGGADALEALGAEAERAGLILSSQQLGNLTALSDAMDRFKATLEGAKNLFASAFSAEIAAGIETITGYIQRLTAAFSEGGLEGLMAELPKVVDELGAKIEEKLPAIVEVGGEILRSLAKGFSALVPLLLPAAVEAITALATAIVEPDTLETILTAAGEVVITLAAGIVKNIPTILTTAWEIIKNLVVSLGAAIWDLIPDKGKETITKFVQGVRDWFTHLFTVGAEIPGKVKEGFDAVVDKVKQWGKDLIDGFIGGIKAKWEDLKTACKQTAQKVKNFLGFSVPEEGPLSDADTYGPDFMQLYANGIKNNAYRVKDAVNDVARSMSMAINPDISNAEVMAGTVNGMQAVMSDNRNQLENMKIYLSTGQLVGGIAPTMNNTLGNAYVQDIRGAMA